MIGTRADPCLKTKGAETWSVLLYLVDCYSMYGENIKSDVAEFTAAEYLAAARELVAMVELMNRGGFKLSRAELDKLLYHWKRFCTLTEHIQELEQPKRHAVSHMVVGAIHFGNPHHYACWFDEALNKILKECCRLRSQKTFEQSVLHAMPNLLKRKLTKVQRW